VDARHHTTLVPPLEQRTGDVRMPALSATSRTGANWSDASNELRPMRTGARHLLMAATSLLLVARGAAGASQPPRSPTPTLPREAADVRAPVAERR
jgi:hypothetical protein